MPAYGLRRVSSGGPVQHSFISSSSRPSRGAKLHGVDDKKLPQEQPHQAGSRGGREIKARAPREEPVMQAMTIETRRALACAMSLFPLRCKGASIVQGIRQRLPFWCNKTKTSRTAGWRSSWSPARRHRQNLWQPKTNFSQDKCTRCSPSKWPIAGALPAHYLGRGPVSHP